MNQGKNKIVNKNKLRKRTNKIYSMIPYIKNLISNKEIRQRQSELIYFASKFKTFND